MGKVIIVSNRLPVSVSKQNGKLLFKQSTGGLTTGLSTYVDQPGNSWIGWPGIASDQLTKDDQELITKELAKFRCLPVFLTQKQVDAFYNGYSNSLLWPLFHNLPMHGLKHRAEWWQGYQEVNRLFADIVQANATHGSRIWVHDYQLMLLPDMLRRALPGGNIGFFLHIPFPTPKALGRLPEAPQLLRGVLGARLAGFHTTGYVNHFLDSCEALGVGTVVNDRVITSSRAVRVTDFPMGIDYKKYARSNRSTAVRAAALKYRLRYSGLKVIVAVDRLDPSKGLVERLEAYKQFLAENPQLHGKVILSMVAAPSRTDIAVYKRLGQQLKQLVNEINTTFGTVWWQPIDYMPISLPTAEVTGLLQIADVAFIAPYRDGMNLVAKEYIASRQRRGVLILSQTAGAAHELHDALLVNPNDRSSLVDALEESLKMPAKELEKRLLSMKRHLSGHTVHHWADEFMTALQQPASLPNALRTPSLTNTGARRLATRYSLARRRLLLIDYDGTLQPFTAKPETAKPSKTILKLLQQLAADKQNDVILISGRHRDDMEAWFGDLPINLMAEHGGLSRLAGHQNWRQAAFVQDQNWQSEIKPIMDAYRLLTPHSTLEEKQYSLVWHYRRSPAYTAQKNLQILIRLLQPLALKYNLRLARGHKILEVKPMEINKGVGAGRWLAQEYDFMLIAGDDYTDEDLFAAAPASAVRLKVGRGRTMADYRLANPAAMVDLLRQLLK